MAAPRSAAPPTALERVFGLDTRSLGAFRVGLGVLVLGDLADRARDLDLYYADSGLLPRALVAAELGDTARFSLHLGTGNPLLVRALFAVHALAALALALGFRTRLATWATWILTVSLQVRSWSLLHGGDTLLRLLLFWGLFLPLGARLSLDQLLDPPPSPAPRRVLSVGTAALLLQLTAMYWFALALRTAPGWWSGEALALALELDSLVRPAGRALLAARPLLGPLTHATLALELFGSIAVLSPWATRSVRRLVVPLFLLLHLGILLVFEIGIFPWAAMVAWIALLPGAELPAPPARATARASRAANVLAASALAYVLVWNVAELERSPLARVLGARFAFPGELLMLRQRWNLFTPEPPRSDGWMVAPGALADGTELDLLRPGRPGSWTRPVALAAEYPSARAWMYASRVRESAPTRAVFIAWLCRSWNEGHDGARRLTGVEVWTVTEDTLPGGGKSAPRRARVGGAACEGTPPTPGSGS
ncbi:MAG: HTTM domain-containing protein [Deltaproteobacteria bacterium]|nr:HTTM domain-containing protein [Deltaproteobacteria bacterium]